MHISLTARIVLIAASLVLTRVAAAEGQPAFKLDLVAAPGLPNGKVRTIKGHARMPGDQFFIEAAGVLQPVVITLIAQKKGDPIDIFIGKQRWDEKLKTGSTGAEGQVTFKLRTQGEVRMTVLAQGEPKPYWLVVWVGDEVKPTLAPVLTSMKAHKESPGSSPGMLGPTIPGAPKPGGSGDSTVSYVIAAALVVIIVLLVMMMFRKRGRK